jgi:hypothetical protein
LGCAMPKDMVSLLALLVSIFALGWNFYRDVILKPRLKVRVQISEIFPPGRNLGSYVDISATNFGPGSIICSSLVARKKFFWGFFWKKPVYYFITCNYTNPLSSELPKRLEIGEGLTLLFDLKEDSFLTGDITHIGIRDSFSRVHWNSRKNTKQVKEEFSHWLEKKNPGKNENGKSSKT